MNPLIIGLSLVCAQSANAPLDPIVTSDLHHDLSPALKNLRPRPDQPFDLEAETLEPVEPALTPNEPQADPVEQRTQGSPLPLTVNLSFEGLGDGQYGFIVRASPPDPVGAVGATQYVQWVNSSYAVFDKFTGDLLAGPTLG